MNRDLCCPHTSPDLTVNAAPSHSHPALGVSEKSFVLLPLATQYPFVYSSAALEQQVEALKNAVCRLGASCGSTSGCTS